MYLHITNILVIKSINHFHKAALRNDLSITKILSHTKTLFQRRRLLILEMHDKFMSEGFNNVYVNKRCKREKMEVSGSEIKR